MMTNQYMDWVMEQADDAYTLNRKDEDHIRLEADNIFGEVNIYHMEMEVVELRLTRKKDDESVFFLHFELRDLDYAKSLFDEMVGVLKKEAERKSLRILLTCTSAMTTSFFAGKLSEGAKTLSLDYDIAAIPYPMLYEKAFDYDVILLAPQIAYEYDKVKEILHEKTVLLIPPSLFGTYDTGGVLEFVREELKKQQKAEQKSAIARVMRDIDNSVTIFVITVTHDLDKTMYRYRLYDKGEVISGGEVRKALNKIDDIYDILDVRLCRCRGEMQPDVVAISMPGVMVERGKKVIGDTPNEAFSRIDYGEFAKQLGERYHLPVYVLNNTDAVAFGYYAGLDKFDYITYHSQPRGSLAGGEGMVVRGHVIEGGFKMSGEINGLYRLMHKEVYGRMGKADSEYIREDLRKFNPPEAILEALTGYLVANICMVDPQVILVRSDLTPDMGLLRKEMEKYIEADRIPELIHIRDISEYAYLGTMLYGLHEYKKSVARKM